MEGRHRDFTLPLFFILLFAAAVAFAARDLDSANNQFPAPAGRQAGTYYGYGGPGNIGGFYGAPGGGPGGWGAGYGGVEVPGEGPVLRQEGHVPQDVLLVLQPRRQRLRRRRRWGVLHRRLQERVHRHLLTL
jgi:hypothetical protein